MPQLDKELYIEYLSCIFLTLIHLNSDSLVMENFFKINSRFFLINNWKKKNIYLSKELIILKTFYNKVLNFNK